MIKINNGSFSYKGFEFGPTDLQIDSGQFVSVVGPSGSGKSTLIKIITGHNKLSNGSIEYIDSTSQDIMYISQMGTTFNHLNVRDNLKLKYDYSDALIIESLRTVGLDTEYIEKFPFELSGGERQRVDIVRALLSKSKYIVLDESMSALDSDNKRSISSLLKSFIINAGITIIYITHDINQALEYSDRIIKLENGKVIFDGDVNKYTSEKRED